MGEQAAEDPSLLRWQGGSKKWRAYCHRGRPPTQFPSGPGRFPVPVDRRWINFSPIRTEGASDFTSEEAKDEPVSAFKGAIRTISKDSAVHLKL
jgi:hypothetical protein